MKKKGLLRFFEIALVFMRFDHVASRRKRGSLHDVIEYP